MIKEQATTTRDLNCVFLWIFFHSGASRQRQSIKKWTRTLSSGCRKSDLCVKTIQKFKMSVDYGETSNLDTIFGEIGEFGLYQITSYLLIFIPNMLSSTFVIGYMFAAKSLEYRWANFLWSLENFNILPFQSQRT